MADTTISFSSRHGEHDLVGKGLAGRMPGISLNPDEPRRARELAERLKGASIQAIYTGPRERAQETAAPLAEVLGRTAQLSEA